jgi:hypothetical protein
MSKFDDKDEDEKDLKDEIEDQEEDEEEESSEAPDDEAEEESEPEESSDDDDDDDGKKKKPRWKERRDRRKAAIERAAREKEEFQETVRSLKQQNEQLQEFVTKVATRVDARDVGEIETRLQTASQKYRDAETYIAQATKVIETAFEAGNSELFGRTFAELERAKEIKSQAANEYNSLKTVVDRLQSTRPTEESRVKEPQWDKQREAAKKDAWLSKNAWYGKDEVASAFAQTVNNKLLAEGYKPDTDAFWGELSKRVREKLPEKFNSSGTKRPPQIVGGRETTVTRSSDNKDDSLPAAFKKVLNERYGRDKSNPERKKAVSYYLQSLKENR